MYSISTSKVSSFATQFLQYKKVRLSIFLTVVSLIFFISPTSVNAQELFPEPGEVFSDDALPRVDIILPQDSLAVIFAPGNEESDYHWHATFIFDNGTIIDTVENVGFRLRGNTSRYSDKKSYKVSFNTYEAGRKFYGLEKMNLNGEHNDPSIMRAKTCWDMARGMEVPGSRSNHVVLYVNDIFFGVYLNVEHIDEEFVDLRFGNKSGNLYKCLWPADLIYKGSDPDLYKEEHSGRRAYDLLTNTEADDYSDLANFIDVLNNTPTEELPCALEPIFNVETFLRAAAFDVLTGNWDGPLFNKNNFYLYNDPVTDKFHYIPYDVDNTFGIDWFGIDWASRDIYNWSSDWEPRPLYSNILAVDKYRDLFTYYMIEFLEDQYNTNFVFPGIDDLKAQIDPFVPDDPFYPLDYGFSFDDFNDSYVEALPYNHTDYGLKPFITTRRFWSGQQLDDDIYPLIFEAKNTFPGIEDDILITTKVVDTNPISEVEVCYQINEGGFSCITLADDGVNDDGEAGNGIYGGTIPAVNQVAILDYYIKATDISNFESQYPSCGYKQIFIGQPAAPVYINEIMASNESTIADEAGEFDDWVELYYTGSEPLYLGDKYLSDDQENPTKWQFNDSWIYPNQFKIVWLDKDEEQGVFHADFKLSSAGEFIGIFNSESYGYALIDGFDFGEQTPDVALARIPNGTGPFEFNDPTPGYSNTPLAAEDNSFERTVYVKPNPFTDYLEFGFEDGHFREVKWMLTDAFGKIHVQDTKGKALDKISLNTALLKPGVYFITLEEESGKRQTKKVVLIR
jgi:hypothetical protein